ncbi:MAG: MBL fold metallo-hydrolase [Alphaproteobacteria bacterium]|nr:MBL fold metallo-hydrolase [Alphaproteobacteria bacterium]
MKRWSIAIALAAAVGVGVGIHDATAQQQIQQQIQQGVQQLLQQTLPQQQQPAQGQQAQTQPAQAPLPIKREITQVKGDVYRFQNANHFSVFMVTPRGIVATDPINADAARWLKDELAKRFPNNPVRYLIYSHDHADHISGGEVFADTATVIAHENAKAQIVAEKRPTAVPTVTFSDQLTLEIGGKAVELTYLGPNHSDNSIVMRFPAEKILFAVDFIPVKAVAFRDFPNAWIGEWIDSLKKVEVMEFDILAPGHGALGTVADVKAFRGYMEELRAAVLAQIRAGKTVDETKATVKMER